MSIAADLSVGPLPTAPHCTVARVLAGLAKDDADALRTALNDPGATHAWIRDVLIRNGCPLAASTIGLHRSGKCRCP